MGLFVDFSRAFDTVNHKLLISKLYRYGVRGTPLKLLKSYLEGRTQATKVNDVKSKCSSIKQGVPQGSILGPLLFILFSNDLINFLGKRSNVSVVCYADDTNILITESNMDLLKYYTEEIYKDVIKWSTINKLNINLSKTQIINFTLSKKQTTHQFLENLGDPIASSKSIKILGLKVDNNLQWTFHIDELCGKLRSSCYALFFMSKHVSRQTLLTLYYANFNSHMRFGIVNWGASSQVNRIFILQKYAVRIISGLNRRNSCRNAFKDLNILTLAGTYILEVCLLVHKNKTSFQVNLASHEYNTRMRDLLKPDTHRTSLYQRSAFYNGCKFYNALDQDIKHSPNTHVFKKKLKKFLLKKNCYTLDEFFTNIE